MRHHNLRRMAAALLAALLALPMTVPARAADGDPAPAGPSVTLDHTTLELGPDNWTATLTATPEGFPTGGRFSYSWKGPNTGMVLISLPDEYNRPNVLDLKVPEAHQKNGGSTEVSVGVLWISDDDKEQKYAETKCVITVTGTDPAPAPSQPPAVPVTGVTLNKTTLSIVEKESEILTATVAPEDAADKTVAWSSSDPAVATVNQSGLVTGVKPGTANITVTTKDGNKTAVCAVTVTKAPVAVAGVYISPNVVQFNRTDARSRQLTVTITPEDADFDQVVWTTEDASVATVTSDGAKGRLAVLTAVGPGTTTVKAMAGTQVAECEVTVSGFTLNLSKVTLMEGKTQSLSLVGPFGQATGAGATTWQSSDPSVAAVNGGRITARSVGVCTITATKGSYTATCEVTVVENTSGLVAVDTPFTAGEEMGFSDKVLSSDRSVRDALNKICMDETGAELSYITNVSVAAEQGTVYYNYLSEGDTGSGVGMTERFYYNPIVGQQSIEKLTFVSRNDFSGIAEISYTGYSANRKTFQGLIRVWVGSMSDVFYNTYSGVHVTFRASDFNSVCQGLTGRDLSYVTFTLPLESRGTLYYNYPGPTPYTEKVTAGTRYRYTSSPNLNYVSFDPAPGYVGTISVTYQGADTAGATFSGRLVITVNQPVISDKANLYYTAEREKQVLFRMNDFDSACRAVTGEVLDYVRFTPPASAVGSLVYDYRGVGSPGTPVESETKYYRSGSPAIGSVSFFSALNAPEQAAITYLGFGTGGSVFQGTVYIDLGEASQQTIRYSVDSGQAVTFRPEDFNNACRTATGDSLNYVRFQLPAAKEGVLCYQYNASTGKYASRVSSATSFFYVGGTRQIDLVTFLADLNHSGTVSFPYTGYTRKGVSFTGTVVIQVNLSSPGRVAVSGTGVDPIRLPSGTFRTACNAVLDKELSYIRFTALPDAGVGRLYLNYSGYGTGVPVSEGAKYYSAGTPGISQVSFVPRGGFQGTVDIPYTAVSVSGKQVNGRLTVTINAVTGSRYFQDMGRHVWAAAATDYLYLNGVAKGMSVGTYGPSLNIRRCDFVVMLCRIFNLTGTATDSFPDVSPDKYYAKEVAAAKRLGIVSGDGRNFRPNDPLTRQDAMVMIRNTLNVVGLGNGGTPVDLDSFTDSAAISDYARSAVGTLVQLGVVKGDNNNRLRPRDIITRAEVAMILHSVMTM